MLRRGLNVKSDCASACFLLVFFSLFLLTNRVNLQVAFSGALLLLALRVEIQCKIARVIFDGDPRACCGEVVASTLVSCVFDV